MFTLKDMRLPQMQGYEFWGYLCGDCGERLFVAWVKGEWVLRCSNLNHKTITRHDYKNEERIRQHRMDSTALTKITEKQMMERVNMGGKFVQELTIEEKRKLAALARFYGFDPATGEMTIYQGRPYISIDGRYRKAQETGLLNGVVSRPATEQEYKLWKVPEDDYFFQAEVRVKGCDYPFVGWGRVFASETIGGKGFKPVEKNPQRMAEKRAEAQALRKAFHIELPSIEEVGTPEDTSVIVESTATAIEAPPAYAPAPAPKKLNLGAVLTWCHAHGKQYDRKWFLDNCGFKEHELDEPAKLEAALGNIIQFTGWDGVKV